MSKKILLIGMLVFAFTCSHSVGDAPTVNNHVIKVEQIQATTMSIERVEIEQEEVKVVSRGNIVRLKREQKDFLYEISDEEMEILYRIVEAEATSGDFDQKANVAQCVINRLGTHQDTITEVVFAKNQFSPVSDGRYYSVEIQESTREAVDSVVANPTRHDSKFFQANYSNSKWFKTLKFDFEDGIHRYYSSDN